MFKCFNINNDHKKIILFIVKPKYIVNYASQSMVGESWNNPIDWYQTNSFSMIKLYNSIANTKLNLKLFIFQPRGIWKYKKLHLRIIHITNDTLWLPE